LLQTLFILLYFFYFSYVNLKLMINAMKQIFLLYQKKKKKKVNVYFKMKKTLYLSAQSDLIAHIICK
jgi:hypothetical protein